VEEVEEVEEVEKLEHKNTFADTLTFYDLQKLPFDVLKEVAENLGYEPSGYRKLALTELIWEQIENNKVTRQNAFSNFELSLFSNKVTFTWYKAATLKGLMNLIVKEKG
ncbi:hypothetical protein ACFDAQ_14490, partial [Enterococcus lactis]